MRISDWSSDVCSSDLSENVDILIDDLRCGCVESSAVDECAAAVESFGPGKHFLRRSPREGEKKNLLGWDAILDKHCRAPRSEERRVGKEWGSTCRSRWSPLQ